MGARADLGRLSLARTAAAAIAALVIAVPAGQRPISASPQATFSTKTEAVYVAATVIDKDGRLVTGLTKSDFEIREAGATREITVFRNDAVPFAIAVMLDVSGSMVVNLGLMRRAVEQLVSRFEPGDRAAIGTFQGLPMITRDFTANPARLMEGVSGAMGGMGTPCGHWDPRVMRDRSGLGSAVWAAVECGILHVASDAETPRRVVMVVTDAMDNASPIGITDVQKLADDYGIMVYAIGMVGMEGVNDVALRGLVESTGGGYFWLKDFPEVVPAFTRIAEELRHQYIFGFTPSSPGVGRLEVRSLRSETTTRWRRVSVAPLPAAMSSSARLAAPSTPPPAASTPSRPTSAPASREGRPAAIDALDRYERAEFVDVLSEPGPNGARPLGDVVRAIPQWVSAGGAAAAPRRRLAAATYLLELLELHARDRAPWLPGQPALVALEWACAELRKYPAQPDEVLWHRAAFGLLERAGASDALLAHLDHVQPRFAGEPRLALARAIARELAIPDRLTMDRDSVPAVTTAGVIAAYAEAERFERERSEAHLRWGYLELRLGHVSEALTHFEAMSASADPYLRYWRQLFTGRALQDAGRVKDAIAQFEGALREAPYAQAASIALGAALVEDHRPSEAAALVIRTLSLQPPVQDPWTAYLAPDMRFWPDTVGHLRNAAAAR